MQQLKDSQERARRAEARAAVLEAENDRLAQELRRAQMERVTAAVGTYTSNDEIIIELQTQLSAAVTRNTQLELQMHEMSYPRASRGADAASPSRKHLL